METVQINTFLFILIFCILGCKGESITEDPFVDYFSNECNILDQRNLIHHCELQLLFDEICYSENRKSSRPVVRLKISRLFKGVKIIRINQGENCSIRTLKESKLNSMYPIYQVNKSRSDLDIESDIVSRTLEGMKDSLPKNVHLAEENYPIYTIEYVDDQTYLKKHQVSSALSLSELAEIKQVFGEF